MKIWYLYEIVIKVEKETNWWLNIKIYITSIINESYSRFDPDSPESNLSPIIGHM